MASAVPVFKFSVNSTTIIRIFLIIAVTFFFAIFVIDGPLVWVWMYTSSSSMQVLSI